MEVITTVEFYVEVKLGRDYLQAHLPEPESLAGSPFDSLSFYLLGDKIFPQKTWLVHPYPGKMLQEDQSVYNYRHSRPRRVIENTFDI